MPIISTIQQFEENRFDVQLLSLVLLLYFIFDTMLFNIEYISPNYISISKNLFQVIIFSLQHDNIFKSFLLKERKSRQETP